jgi:hypothetical protein
MNTRRAPKLRAQSREHIEAGYSVLAYRARAGTFRFRVVHFLLWRANETCAIEASPPWDEAFDIGADTGTPVDDQDYQVPFRFTGKIDKLTVKVAPPRLTPEDERQLMSAQRSAADDQ